MTEQTNTFGKYEILGELGRGGFATVYRARDTTLGREVALKLLDPSRTWEPGFVERFYQEARVAAQLKHPNIITVYEIGEIDGQLFIAMELAVEGALAELLEGKGRVSPEEAAELLTPIADALDYAHAQGIIHRDIKPANFMLDLNRDGSVRPILSDFGLVKALSHSTELTRSGTVLGTPKYMAPEQIDPDLQHLLGPATDIYALGIVVFQMFTGQVPFEGNSTQISYAHVHKQPPSPTDIRSDIPENVSEAILRALAKDPDTRYPTASAFIDTIVPVEIPQETQPTKQPPREESQPPASSVIDVAITSPVRNDVISGRRQKRRQIIGWLAIIALILIGISALTFRPIALALFPTSTAQFYFTSQREDNKKEIYLRFSDGREEPVTNTQRGGSWDPVVAPDGSLYFASNREDNKREIYHMGKDGIVRRMTHTSSFFESWSPAVGPDGNLFFTSNRTGTHQIWLGRDDADVQKTEKGINNHPTISSTGTLYFSSIRNRNLEIYRLLGGYDARITNTNDGDSWEPAIAPNGSLYFTSNIAGNREVYRTSEGVTERMTVSGSAGSWSPVVGLDGEIYFTSARSGRQEVYHLAGNNQTQRITHTPGGGVSFVGDG